VLYGQNGERLVETDENGNILMESVYLNGQLLTIYTPDDDQDGIPNTQEAKQGTLPINTDGDGDGLTNLTEWYQYGTDSANPDSDGDGVLDGVEIASGTNPNQRTSFPGDGDINGNGGTNVGDLVLLYQFVMGNRIPTATELTHGDMNRDGMLNVADILLLQKQLLQVWLGIEGDTVLAEAKIGRQQVQASTALPVLDWLITPVQALPNNSGFLYYVHNDPLGTPQALTNEAGTVVWTAQYDPFGKATVNEDPDGDGNSVTLNVRFPGQYYDQETGLHYNYFRYYDPSIGRYTRVDPIGLSVGSGLVEVTDGQVMPLSSSEQLLVGLNHPYTYVDNNAINFIDPLGLLKFSAGARGSFFFGGAGGTAGGSVGFDTSGQVCFQVQTCGRLGVGGSISAAGTLSAGTGNFCEGNSLGGGAFGTLGLGPIGSVSTNTTSSGTTVSGALGIGGGGSGGVQACITRTFCKQLF